jgi:MFS family permease
MMYFCYGYYMQTIVVHIVPHSTGLGLSPSTAANVLAVIGATSIVSRLTAGVISDRIGIKPTLVIALIGLLISLVWIQTVDSLWGLILFSVAFGITLGAPMTMQSLLLAELFGLGSLGVIVGIATFIYTIGSAIGPAMAGYVHDISGSYIPAFLICSVVAVMAVALVMLMKPVKDNHAPDTSDTD